jgi:hypothetical protein
MAVKLSGLGGGRNCLLQIARYTALMNICIFTEAL